MKPRLILFELHHLGDLVMAVPFLKAATSQYELHLVCRPCGKELFARWTSLSLHIWNPPWDPDPGCPKGKIFQIARELRKLKAPVAACSWPDARIGWMMRLAGVKRRVGFPMTPGNYHAHHLPWRKRNLQIGRILEAPLPGRLYTDPCHRTNPRQHRMEDWNALAQALDLKLDFSPPWWPVEIWPARSNSSSRLRLAIAPFARLPGKTWPLEKFVSVARQVIEEMGEGAPEIRVLHPGETIVSSLEWPEECRLQATQTLEDLACCLQEVDLVLANDSFVGHFAASLGRKVITIFGSGEPDWFRPWGRGNRVIRVPNCLHHPCIDRCFYPTPICLDAVTPELVLEVLLSEMRSF